MWVVSAARGHRGDNHRGDIAVQLIGGDDQAGAGFLNLTAYRWGEVHQPDLEALDYQLHSSVSQLVSASGSPSKSASSPACAIA